MLKTNYSRGRLNIIYYREICRPRWYGHIGRMDERFGVRCRTVKVVNSVQRGRPRETREGIIKMVEIKRSKFLKAVQRMAAVKWTLNMMKFIQRQNE